MSSHVAGKEAILRKYNTLLFIALIITGLAGNHFNFEIFFNIDFLFGSIFAMLALQLLGLGRGILAAAIIAGYTYLLWNHPYAIIIMTTEVAVVGWLTTRRKLGLVLADTLYWLIIGMPLVYLFYHVGMDVPASNTFIVMIKQSINGITNALIARLIYTGYLLCDKTARISYNDTIYNLLAFFVLFPVLILLAIGSRNDFDETNLQIRKSLVQDSLSITTILETWIFNNKTGIAKLAKMAASRSAAQMQPHLEQAQESNENFLRTGLMDKNATITAYTTLIDYSGKNSIGKNYSDRQYITRLKQTLQPMLTEVIIARVGNPEPIVAILAPIVVNGKYNGYAIGVLSLEQIREYFNKFFKHNSSFYTLIDINNNVIITNRTDQKVMTPFMRTNGRLNHLENGMLQWIPTVSVNTPISEQWKKSLYISEISIGSQAEWKLILEQPVAPFQKALYDKYANKLTLLFVILIVSLALAGLLTRQITITLKTLSSITKDLTIKLTDGWPIHWPESNITEAHTLIGNFQEMSSNIQHHVIELDNLNKSLQQQIAERTKELDDKMGELQIILENAPIGISQTILRKMLWSNKKTEEMLMYSKEEMDSHTTRDLFSSENDFIKFGEEVYPVLAKGSVFEAVLEITRKDGIKILVRTRAKALNPDDLSLGVIWLMEDITDIKKNEKLAEEFKNEKHRFAAIEKEQQNQREKEMLVKDLHDGIGGIISNISMLAQYGILSESKQSCHITMQQIAELAIEGTTEIRSFMNSMEDGDATWNNLIADIRAHCSNMLVPHDTGFNFIININKKTPNPGLFCYINIVRILRELVANTVKHAKASQVTITFETSKKMFFIEVKDNGVGFDYSTVKHRGLGNISSRSKTMGASFDITSSDSGTCARLKLDC